MSERLLPRAGAVRLVSQGLRLVSRVPRSCAHGFAILSEQLGQLAELLGKFAEKRP